jgi:phosphatidylcholine synthase
MDERPASPSWSPARYAAAWGVHLLTASGAPAGVFAILATVRGDVRTAFGWMAYTLFIDAVDGTLARAVRVKEVLPFVDGARLDDCVDYFTYVIVPIVFVLLTGMVPAAAALPVAAAIAVASGYGFAQTAAKTADHFFTGFPSYWNVVVFYLWALDWAPRTNAAVLLALAVLVFVPIRYVYPSRTPAFRGLTLAFGVAWSVVMLWTLAHVPEAPRGVVTASLAYPAYYVGLSLWLQCRRVS